MAHDEAAAGLLQHVTDTHLADRARLGDAVAFDELYRRHADTVARFAAVVTADAASAPAVTARAFTDVFDEMGSGGYSIEDPFLPGLLRSTRAVARIEVPDADAIDATGPTASGPTASGPTGSGDLADAALWRLPEAERSVRWLESVVGMDEEDLALSLDTTEAGAAALASAAAEHLGSHAEASQRVLADLAIDLPAATADDARTTWRGWIATVGVAPVVAVARRGGRVQARLEPVATRVLRGAAVLLLVAGAAGIALDGDDSTGGSRRGTSTQLASGTDGDGGTRVDSPELGGEVELSGSRRASTPSTTAAGGGSGSGSAPGPGSAAARAATSDADAAGPTGRAAAGASPTATLPGGTASTGAGAPGGATTPAANAPGASPAPAPAPTSPAPTAPSSPPVPSAPPVTAPPVTSPPAPTPPPVTSPPAPVATLPPPPAPAPTTPSNPIGTIVDSVTKPVTGLLGGG